MKDWKKITEDLSKMINHVYVFKEHKIYTDLDTMIKITREYSKMKLKENEDKEDLDKINTLVLKLQTSHVRSEINEILYN